MMRDSDAYVCVRSSVSISLSLTVNAQNDAHVDDDNSVRNSVKSFDFLSGTKVA